MSMIDDLNISQNRLFEKSQTASRGKYRRYLHSSKNAIPSKNINPKSEAKIHQNKSGSVFKNSKISKSLQKSQNSIEQPQFIVVSMAQSTERTHKSKKRDTTGKWKTQHSRCKSNQSHFQECGSNLLSNKQQKKRANIRIRSQSLIQSLKQYAEELDSENFTNLGAIKHPCVLQQKLSNCDESTILPLRTLQNNQSSQSDYLKAKEPLNLKQNQRYTFSDKQYFPTQNLLENDKELKGCRTDSEIQEERKMRDQINKLKKMNIRRIIKGRPEFYDHVFTNSQKSKQLSKKNVRDTLKENNSNQFYLGGTKSLEIEDELVVNKEPSSSTEPSESLNIDGSNIEILKERTNFVQNQCHKRQANTLQQTDMLEGSKIEAISYIFSKNSTRIEELAKSFNNNFNRRKNQKSVAREKNRMNSSLTEQKETTNYLRVNQQKSKRAPLKNRENIENQGIKPFSIKNSQNSTAYYEVVEPSVLISQNVAIKKKPFGTGPNRKLAVNINISRNSAMIKKRQQIDSYFMQKNSNRNEHEELKSFQDSDRDASLCQLL